MKIAVSGVNPTDWKHAPGGLLTDGQMDAIPFDDVVPNHDGAGVIDAVGSAVPDTRVGERVWVYLAQMNRPTGTAQEYTIIPASHAVALADGVGYDIGASLGVPAMTAHRLLTVHGRNDRLHPGALFERTVLVAGGAGAVGHAAIQLARWAGATVLATVSGPAKAALARNAGAHHVVNYRDSDVVAQVAVLAPGGVDQVVEVSPSANMELNLAVLKNKGCIAYYADDGDEFTVPVTAMITKNVRLQAVLLGTLDQDDLDAIAADVTAAVLAGALPVGERHGLPLTWFDLAGTADAHAAVRSGAIGKVLINVSDEAFAAERH